jgi:hypothetical protein
VVVFRIGALRAYWRSLLVRFRGLGFFWPTGSLLISEKGPHSVRSEPNSWFDLSVFTGIEQSYLEQTSPPHPASTNYRYSRLQ